MASVSKHVFVNDAGVAAAGASLMDSARQANFSLNNWSANELHPSQPDEMTPDWLFVLDSLNFSFWSSSGTLFAGILFFVAIHEQLIIAASNTQDIGLLSPLSIGHLM